MDYMDCECKTWAVLDVRLVMLCGHHPNCEHAKAPLDAAFELIHALAKGMEAWAQDEDGVHPDAWEPYRKAKALERVFLPPDQDEQNNRRATMAKSKAGRGAKGTCGGTRRNTHFLPEAPEIDGPVSATLHDNPM